VSLVVVLGKCFNVTLVSLLAGVEVKTAVQNGFSLAQIGEFAFMVAIVYKSITRGGGDAMFQIAVGVSLLTTLLNPWMIRLSGPVGDFAERCVPERFRRIHEAYRAWIAKIGASENSHAFRRLKFAAIRLGIYAVLMVAVAAMCTVLGRYDYSSVSTFVESHARAFYFCLANLFCLGLVPLVASAAKPLSDSVAAILCGEGTFRWQVAVHQLVNYVVLVAVFVLFFVEWAMIAVSMSPTKGPTLWISVAVIVLIGAVGWRRIVKTGRRASKRMHDALTAEERRASLARTMTVQVPEGTFSEIVIPSTSPAIGGTVVTLNIRAKTGASIVTAIRKGVINRNVGPEWEFQGGDKIVALGDHSQIVALKDLLGVTS